MNIVKIQHYGNGGTFLFSVPDGIQLSKNQKVTVLTKYGEKEGTCVEDSMVIDDKVLEYLAAVAQYKLPLKPVLGIWGYQEFEKPEVKEPEVIRLLCVQDLGNNWLTVGKIYESVNGRITVDTGETYTDRYMIEGARLFPLVKRPARVGEWVRVIEANGGKVLGGTIWQVEDIAKYDERSPLVFRDGWMCKDDNYEVIDGYNGEYHA
jgi:hypothetical protein